MHPNSLQKPVMDVASPPRSATSEVLTMHEPPKASGVASQINPTATPPQQTTPASPVPVKKEANPATTPKGPIQPAPVATVIVTILVMGILAFLAVIIYLDSQGMR